MDHVVPLDTGGTDELANLATLCRDCNLGKSAFRFTDYRAMQVAPDDLELRFSYFHDDRTGDAERFHLYCYFQHGTEPGGRSDKFHHSWTIPGTLWDTSADRTALAERCRAEESAVFTQTIRLQLVTDRRRLTVTEEGLCLVAAK